MKNQQKTSNEICNYFFQECGATISKKDYDFVLDKIKELLAEYTITTE